MSEARTLAGAALVRRAWYEWLCYCLPLVFVIGAPCIFVTRAVFREYYPSHFVDSSPTISETAGYWPSSQFFLWPMLVVAVCIIVSWSLNFARNRRRLAERNVHDSAQLLLNWASYLSGIFAAGALATIAMFNLTDGHDVHMAGSWAFYISQVLSITLDILFVLRKPRVMGLSAHQGLWSRVAVASGIFVGSLFFLYMYLTKGYAAPSDKLLIQEIYINSEYAVCLLCLFYPITGYGELRRDLHDFAAADRSRFQLV